VLIYRERKVDPDRSFGPIAEPCVLDHLKRSTQAGVGIDSRLQQAVALVMGQVPGHLKGLVILHGISPVLDRTARSLGVVKAPGPIIERHR
jgi:hypothetical protein